MTDLNGQTALLVGGSGGIGLALAKGVAQAGATVIVAARTEAKVRKAEADLRQIDKGALGLVADVTDLAETDRLLDRVTEERGLPDILVTCQGTTVIAPSDETTEADYDRVMNVNLKSVFFCCTRFGNAMRRRGSGSIINIASLSAHRGWPKAAVYAMTKHGILGLTRTLAAEWGESGVRVNSISPGFFLTDLNRERMAEDRKRSALARTPMGRFGEVEELVSACLYLSSDMSRFVTGTDIVVDGGYLASGI